MALVIEYCLKHWRYSDAPEGQKPFDKVIGLSKFGFFAGLGAGTYDSIFFSQAYTFWSSVNCLAFWTVPLTAMCATFASVAYTTTKLRGGKDGYANYIVASLATTGVFYHWQKQGKLAFSFGTILMMLAMVKKHGDLVNWKPFSFEMLKEGMIMSDQHTTVPFDWTLTKDPRGPRPWE